MSEQRRKEDRRERDRPETDEVTQEDSAGEDGLETAESTEGEAAEAEAEPDLEARLADMKDRLLRAMAETENIRRRSEREKAEAQKFGISRFARDLLSVADNLRRAIEAVPDDRREDLDEVTRNLITGVEMVERELLTAFERHGIRILDPGKGTKFDPNLHQAMAEVPDPDAAPGTISSVFQTGYVIEDRLLRPAMVTVARAAPDAPPGDAAEGGDAGSEESAGSKS